MVEVKIPDIGDFDEVEVIEILVSVGDVVSTEDPLLTLESDKATMEIPAPESGTIKKLIVAVGDMVSEGTVVMQIEGGPSVAQETAPEKTVQAPQITESDASTTDQPRIDVETPKVQSETPGTYHVETVKKSDGTLAHASPGPGC